MRDDRVAGGREVVILADVAAEGARRFVKGAAEAVAERGRFTVALAGGSTPAGLYRLLGGPAYRGEVDWERTLVFFGDERCVAPEHPDSNYRMAHENLLAHVPVPAANVHRMAGELPGAAAAEQYALELAAVFSVATERWQDMPRFDLILLGMGDDGHTASLFPGMPALAEMRHPVMPTPAPAYIRPAVARLTLTLPVFNAARQVLFLVAGAAKAQAVRRVFDGPLPGQDPLPAARVQPTQGDLVWLLDEAAGRNVT